MVWEAQIKAYQDQQKQYLDQIHKAKAVILSARRSLQSVSKKVGGVAAKTEEEITDAQGDEQAVEPQDVMLSDDEGPKNKRPRSLEPLGHASPMPTDGGYAEDSGKM